ncbi:MAG: zf-HC2 domain-containing protein [Gemmatimonadota bacterium]|nr:zf-HC2 domain-containing protein [Gemmatimonadota bacterium]MDH5760422.1 zf-HC2 domain-containing protein [Gemmatimonadota bacterium]
MKCSEILEHFSDYLDGVASSPMRAEIEAHLSECGDCQRYRDVVDRGVAILRDLPGAPLRDDFRPRLRHRIYHLDDERILDGGATSATTAVTALGMAAVLLLAAWSPALRSAPPTVRLLPIAATAPRIPAVRPMRLPQVREGFLTAATVRPASIGSVRTELWEDAHLLLQEYSPVSRQYRGQASLLRTGLENEH